MDWDLRDTTLEDYFASFDNRRAPDAGIWNLSKACSALPPAHVGFRAWITMVSGVGHHRIELQRWAVALADHIGVMRVRRSRRIEPFTNTYRRDWGHRAGLDGLCIAIFGRDDIPGGYRRAEQFDCDKRAYQRVRNFVTGAVVLAMNQFREELARTFRGTALEEWDHGRDFHRLATVQHSEDTHLVFGGNSITAPLPASDEAGINRPYSDLGD